MENNKVKSQHYNLVIDRDRDMLLTMLFNLVAKYPNEPFLKKLKELHLEEALKEFVVDATDKQHNLKWCLDPNCDYQTSEEEPE